MKDLTKTHLKETVDENGKKHKVIKPVKVERTVDENGKEHVIVTIPKIVTKSRSNL